MAFLLEFIPIIGVLISGAACVLLALTQGWLTALLVLAYFVFVHIIEGDVVGPRVVGKAVGVHPAVSIVALVAGGELFGIWGALFASPIAGLIQTVATELWRDWRLTHASQFPEQFGPPVVPVTTAEAAKGGLLATTATETGIVTTAATETITPAAREPSPEQPMQDVAVPSPGAPPAPFAVSLPTAATGPTEPAGQDRESKHAARRSTGALRTRPMRRSPRPPPAAPSDQPPARL